MFVQFAERLVVAVVPLRFTPTVVVPEASRLLWTYIYLGPTRTTVSKSCRNGGTVNCAVIESEGR